MAAGKNYLDYTALAGVPAAIPVYYTEAGVMTLTPTSGYRVMLMPVLKDGSGHFVDAPLDPASITGLADLVQ